MHLLPELRRRLQADEFLQMGSPVVRHVDTRGDPWQSHLHGARDGCREGPQGPLEIDLLHL